MDTRYHGHDTRWTCDTMQTDQVQLHQNPRIRNINTIAMKIPAEDMYTRSLSHSFSLTHSLSLSLPLTHTHLFPLSLSHKHSYALSPFLTSTLSFSLSLSLSLSHSHSHTQRNQIKLNQIK